MAYTNIDDPSAYFTTTLWTGAGGSPRAITNDANSGNFQPDFIWTKGRNEAYEHQLYDSSRGAGTTKGLTSNDTTAEGNYSATYGYMSSINSNGFTGTAGTSGQNAYFDTNAKTYVAWQWKANGGTTASNTEGNVTNTLQVNQDAGFSISKFTSASSGNTTIGHGLGVAPACFITKIASGTSGWWVNHKGLTNQSDKYLGLNVTQAEGTISWGAAPTSTLITMAPAFIGNGTTTVMCYAFAEKQGYSKFGKYVGNGNADGTFVYTGFKPAFVIVKRSDSANNWIITDNARGINGANPRLYADLGDAEGSAADYIDHLSNGFKIRTSAGSMNTSGGSYIYMAFAENPFTTSTGIPTTAR